MWNAGHIKNKVELKCASFGRRTVGSSRKMFAILTTCTPIYCQLEGAMQFSGNFESGNDFHK